MRHRSIQALYRYWQRMRGDAAAPRRVDIEPRGMADSLADAFLLDGEVSDYPFRLAGSRLEAEMGRPLTFSSFGALWLPPVRLEARRLLEIAAIEGEPILLGVRLLPSLARAEPFRPQAALAHAWPAERRRNAGRHGELLLLPLIHQGRIGGRILGGMACAGDLDGLGETKPLLEISGTRMLSSAAIAKPPRLFDGVHAEHVISRHGHLVLMRGLKGQQN